MATPVSTAVLKAVPLFASIPEDQLRLLAMVVTRKSAPRSTTIMAGGDPTDSLYIVLSGRLKGIAVTTLERSSALPQVPTVDESGYPGFSVDNMYGILTTAGTPRATIDRLNVELVRILKLPEVHERLASQGYDPVANKPEEFARYLRAEVTRWGKVIREAGLKVE